MGDFSSRIIRAFQMGQQAKMQREQMAQQDEERRLRIDMLRHQLRGEKLGEQFARRAAQQGAVGAAEQRPGPVFNLPNPAAMQPTDTNQLAPREFQKAPVALSPVVDPDSGAELVPGQNVVPRSAAEVLADAIAKRRAAMGGTVPVQVGGQSLEVPHAAALSHLSRSTEPRYNFFPSPTDDGGVEQRVGVVTPVPGAAPRVESYPVGAKVPVRSEFERLFEREEGELPGLSDRVDFAGQQAKARAAVTPRSGGGMAKLKQFAAQQKAYTALSAKIGSEVLASGKRGKPVSGAAIMDALLQQHGADLAATGVDVPKLRADLSKVFAPPGASRGPR